MSIDFSLQIRDSYEINQSQGHHAPTTTGIFSLIFTGFLSSSEPILRKGLIFRCLEFLKCSGQYFEYYFRGSL